MIRIHTINSGIPMIEEYRGFPAHIERGINSIIKAIGTNHDDVQENAEVGIHYLVNFMYENTDGIERNRIANSRVEVVFEKDRMD